MNSFRTPSSRNAFTLVEILVVIAIIVLLISILIPATSVIRSRAKKTQTQALFSGLEQGIESYRGEQYLGGTYPPSATDQAEIDKRSKMADPLSEDENAEIEVAGAHLLVDALLGAELLGTPGFRDLDRDGFWWDDQSKATGKAYELGEPGEPNEYEPLVARYGGSGYVSEDTKSHYVSSIRELNDNGGIRNVPDNMDCTKVDGEGHPIGTCAQRFFIDSWERPLLYYKANPSGKRIIATASNPNGVFWQEDNGVITGSFNGARGKMKPVEFVFTDDNKVTHKHEIDSAASPDPPPDINPESGLDKLEHEDPRFDYSLARFIFNPGIKVRREPYNKESYLLISAGEDGRYGTLDDITNWTRK